MNKIFLIFTFISCLLFYCGGGNQTTPVIASEPAPKTLMSENKNIPTPTQKPQESFATKGWQDHRDLYDKILSVYQPLDRSHANSKTESVENDFLEITATEEGLFTIGGDSDDLLYGHPNGYYMDEIGSSYATIYVNEDIYKFHEMPIIEPLVKKKADNKVILTITRGIKNKVEITQNLILDTTNDPSKISDSGRMALLEWSFKNTSHSRINVGLRLLLDTWLDNYDASSFLVSGLSSDGKSTLTFYDTESMIKTITTSPIYAANWLKGKYGVEIKFDQNPPDHYGFFNWQKAYKNPWEDIEPSNDSILNDSTVVIWYKPVFLRPGLTLTSRVYIGITNFGVNESIENSATLTNPVITDSNDTYQMILALTKLQDNSVSLPFSIHQIIELSDQSNDIYENEINKNPVKINNNIISAWNIAGYQSISTYYSKLGVLAQGLPVHIIGPMGNYQINLQKQIGDLKMDIPIKCKIMNPFIFSVKSSIPALKNPYEPVRIPVNIYCDKNFLNIGDILVASLFDSSNPEKPVARIVLYDDGLHYDQEAGDNIYGGVFNLILPGEEYFIKVQVYNK